MTVLLRGLSFSNGGALNKDNDFVLITKTTTLLHDLLDVQILFKKTLVKSFGLRKIIIGYQISKSN